MEHPLNVTGSLNLRMLPGSRLPYLLDRPYLTDITLLCLGRDVEPITGSGSNSFETIELILSSHDRCVIPPPLMRVTSNTPSTGVFQHLSRLVELEDAVLARGK